MKIIIDIPEETVNEIKDNVMFADNISSDIRWGITSAIANGTPFPKGHGRLIDADELLEKQYCIDDSATLSTRDVVDVEDVDDAPTIIDADMKGDE